MIVANKVFKKNKIYAIITAYNTEFIFMTSDYHTNFTTTITELRY